MTRPEFTDECAAEAVECLLCLSDPQARSDERARWAAWLSADPQNRAAFNAAREAWRHPIPNDVWPSQAEIDDDPYDPSDPIPVKGRGARLPRDQVGQRAAARGLSPTLALVAGCLAAVVAVASLWEVFGAGPEQVVAYETTRGEIRHVALAGGSSVVLGPLSRLSVAGRDGRSVKLEGGEGMFTVAYDPAHPFHVSVRGGDIRDLGTVFEVALVNDRATVTVVEGQVSVAVSGEAPVALAKDRRVSFTRTIGAVETVDGHAETGWSRGRLAYVDRPLSDVVTDLARYTTLDIAVGDASVGALRYTGTVEPEAIEAWLAVLPHAFPLRVDRAGNRIVLRTTTS